MPFEIKNSKGETFYLHATTKKRNGTPVLKPLHYFSRVKEGAVEFPEGYTTIENPRTHLPCLKKKQPEQPKQ